MSQQQQQNSPPPPPPQTTQPQQPQQQQQPKLTGGGPPTTDSRFIVTLENFEGSNIYGKPLGRSCRKGYAMKFASAVATRMALGHDYRPDVDGDVFYDPVINGSEPTDEYLRWMTDEESAALKPEENVGGVFVAGIVHVSDSNTLLRGCRRIKRRFCVYDTELTVFDLMAMETEGDQELARLMKMPLPPLGAPEAQSSTGGVSSGELMARKYLPAAPYSHCAATGDLGNRIKCIEGSAARSSRGCTIEEEVVDDNDGSDI